MKRKEAEKLLAALIFDDLDEASKTKLLTYLQSDDELRERLADMRMAVKMTSDTVRHGPEPVLDKRRLKRLTKLARHHRSQTTIFTVPRLTAAAAIFIIASVGLALLLNTMPAMNSSKEVAFAHVSNERDFASEQVIHAGTPSDSEGKKFAETSLGRRKGKYVYDPVAQSPVDTGGGTIVTGPISNDGRLFVKDDIGGITGAQTRFFSVNAPQSDKPSPTEKRTSAGPFDETLRFGTRNSGTYGDMIGGMGGMGGGYGGGMMGGMGGMSGGYGEMGGSDKTGGHGGDGGMGLDGDGITAWGRSNFLHNGDAAGIQIDGTTIDNFIAADDDGGRRSVAVVTEEPVASTKPELALPSQPMRGASSPLDLPALKLPDEGTESHVMWDTKSGEWSDSSWRVKAHNKNEADFNKLDELGTKDYQDASEKAKPVVPPYDKVVDYNWKGDVSKKEEEASIDDGEVTPATGTEKYVKELSELTGEIESLLEKAQTQSTGSVSLSSMGGVVDKEENGRKTIPILGDIPIAGGLFGRDGKKRPLSVEEKERIVNYLKEKQITEGLEPEGVSVTAAMPTKPYPNLEYDESSAVNRTGILPGEDEPDLPPALRFKLVPVNPWVMAERDSLSTFALDVDTASYTLCRRYIRGGFLPPAGAVRMEEFVNYFNYNYPQRTNPTFMVHTEAAASPFAGKDKNLTLLKIGVKARTIGRDQRKAAHLIFVVDASASMGQPDRLPFVQQALDLLVNKLSGIDRVSLITCANEARLHLESIPARERERIRQAIYAIQSAGSTNLLAGLKLGYATARRSFAPKQINHVVLCSDGVANVGQTEAEAVLEEVAADRKQGITITCVGVGYGSYNDAFLEALANRGDGSYMFLDSARQAQQVFVKQLAATLQTVAKDARIQVDFNPHRVRRYRLIGYENRDIEDKRFRDDTIDAGEVGSGQCSTALYELELIGQPSADRQGDLGIVFVRYRDVETGQIEEISSRLSSAVVQRHTVASAPRFFLAAGAARFAEILRQSEHAQHGNLTDVLRVAEQVSLALPLDRDVGELVELIRKAEHLPRAP